MNINSKLILGSAIGGFVGAFLADLHAWSQTKGTFDWELAVRRWTYGVAAGAASGAGIAQVPA